MCREPQVAFSSLPPQSSCSSNNIRGQLLWPAWGWDGPWAERESNRAFLLGRSRKREGGREGEGVGVGWDEMQPVSLSPQVVQPQFGAI